MYSSSDTSIFKRQIWYLRQSWGLFTWREGAPASRATWLEGLKHRPPLHATRLTGTVSGLRGLCFERPLSTTNKMADQKKHFGGKFNFFLTHSASGLFSIFRTVFFCTLLIQRNQQSQLTLKSALDYNAALAKPRHVRRRVFAAVATVAKSRPNRSVVAKPVQRCST